MTTNDSATAKPGHVRVLLESLYPAPENDLLYGAMYLYDSDTVKLTRDIRKEGRP